MRIVTVSLHPAIDRIIRIEKLVPGATFNSELLMTVAAGKGLNTARSAKCICGTTGVVAAAWVGRSEADVFESQLRKEKIQCALSLRDCATRYTCTILEKDGRETHMKESMPPPTLGEDYALKTWWRRTVRKGDRVALCGSAPAGTRPAVVENIFEIAQRKGVSEIIADSSGMALEVAGRMGLDAIKGNAAEIGAWLELDGPLDVNERSHRLALSRAFERRGAPLAIIITRGVHGAVLAVRRVPHLLIVEPPPLPASARRKAGTLMTATGCGDAATAGWLWASSRGLSLDERLRAAVACGTAKLASTDPGHVEARLFSQLFKRAIVRRVDK
jgi:fructose-1-phosphate kinase PfkB-like protein